MLRKSTEAPDVFRAFDLDGSNPLSYYAWLGVVLQVSPRLFSSADEAIADDQLLKELEASDEILVNAADVRTPHFALLKQNPN